MKAMAIKIFFFKYLYLQYVYKQLINNSLNKSEFSHLIVNYSNMIILYSFNYKLF